MVKQKVRVRRGKVQQVRSCHNLPCFTTNHHNHNYNHHQVIIADQPHSSSRLHQWNRKSAKQRGYRAQHEETHHPPSIGPSMVVCLRTHRLRGLSPKSNEDHITFLIFEDFFPHIFRTSQHQNHQYQYFSA